MDINKSLILEYAKKIFGFAYLKTKNYHDAEDLSQNILVQLFDKRIDFSEIENVDAYIFRICSYTWSNYYRKNKPMWNALDNASKLDIFKIDENIEESYIQNELYEKLRQEVMFLSKTRRNITVMFYYENKTGNEISKILSIPASTVRWHMRETKNLLKERIEMIQQHDIYEPVKLIIGHSGWVQNYDMNGLASDIIMQNICWICRERALTTEEIARTLGIAAVYLEDKIEKLLYMDYLKLVGTNRYQTTFFIHDLNYAIKAAQFKYDNALKLAVPVYNMLKDKLVKANKLLIFDGEFSEDFLLSALFMPEIYRINNYLNHLACKEKNIICVTPKRKDGSKHWVSAQTRYLSEIIGCDSISNELKDFIKNSGGPGVRIIECGRVQSMKYDIDLFGGWRDFENSDLRHMERVHEIILNGETPNEYDKDAIANLVAKGYVRVEDRKPVILVPYLRKVFTSEDDIVKVLDKYWQELDSYVSIKEMVGLLIQNMEYMEQFMPAYLDKNERNSLLSGCGTLGNTQIMYMLFINGFLKMPNEDEKKRICTYIWEK